MANFWESAVHSADSMCEIAIFLLFLIFQTILTIRITCPCVLNPLTSHFYIVKLGLTGVCIIFLIFAPKHRLWVLVRKLSFLQP